MKVICITRENFEGEIGEGAPEPEVGEILTVTKSGLCPCPEIGKFIPCYKFKEYQTFWYDQRNFAPLTGIDETELFKERIT